MNFTHAFGFLVVGVVAGLLPRFAPGLCPPTGVDGSSTRELWLQVMCFVQVGIATLYFLQRLGAWLSILMQYTPQEVPVTATVRPATTIPAVPAWRQAAAARAAARPAIIPLPVSLDAGLLDQRRAA